MQKYCELSQRPHIQNGQSKLILDLNSSKGNSSAAWVSDIQVKVLVFTISTQTQTHGVGLIYIHMVNVMKIS